MEAENWNKEDVTKTAAAEDISRTAAERRRSAKSYDVGNIKNVVADKLHSVAQIISRKTAAAAEVKPEVAHYGEQASLILDQAADYIEDLDYDQVKTSTREYIKENPGRSLLIAGITGLVIGSILRRR